MDHRSRPTRAAAGHAISRRSVLGGVGATLVVGALSSAGSAAARSREPGEHAGPGSAFVTPPMRQRPRLRYWLPQAAVREEDLRAEIRRLSDMGIGSVEVVAVASPVTDAAYGWGTDRWNEAMVACTDEAKRLGMTVDFANGPKWPIAMPSLTSVDDPASLYELTYGIQSVPAGETYRGPVPGRRKVRPEGTPKLMAVIAYAMPADKSLDLSTFRDLTDEVTADSGETSTGTLSFTAPAGGPSWVLLSFWEQPAGQKVEGHYVIDHMATAGAAACADHWENEFLPALGKGAGTAGAIFCDSLEYEVTMEWTRGFRDLFRRRKGYDITPYLPFVGLARTYPLNDIPGFTSTQPDITETVNNDYLETLTHLYEVAHLKPLQELAARHGMDVRYQVAYNKPFEVESSAYHVGIPECEALGRGTLDNMRMMSAAVNLGRKKEHSIEVAPEFVGSTYAQTFQDIVWWNKRAWASGVNHQTLHGGTYSGGYDGPGNVEGNLPGVAWPGFQIFRGYVSNNWNRPTSVELFRGVTDYLARVNHILGRTAKVDVAVYRNAPDSYATTGIGGDGTHLYPDKGVLNSHGYSYEFVSPSLLALPQAVVEGRVLDRGGPAYKALIIHHQDRMPLTAAQRILSYARSGLRVVIVGDPPSGPMYFSERKKGVSAKDVQRVFAELLACGSVARAADYADVPRTLLSLGATPDARHLQPRDVLARHHTDDTGHYYYLYNYNKVTAADAAASAPPSPEKTAYPTIDKAAAFTDKDIEVELTGQGRPYEFDAWSGRITPLAQYTVKGGKVRLSLRLKGDEAAVIGLLTSDQARRQGCAVPRVHATATSPGSWVEYVNDDLVLKTSEPGTYTTWLSDGTRHVSRIRAAGTRPLAIRKWQLRVTTMEAAENSKTYAESASRSLGPYALTEGLKPWNRIDPELEHVSGVGDYTATFTLPHRLRGGGAWIDLGEVNDVFSVRINGTDLPPADQLDTVIDAGPYLRSGTNTIEVRVATTLANAVNPAAGHRYGLLGSDGEVTITPYTRAVVTRSTAGRRSDRR